MLQNNFYDHLTAFRRPNVFNPWSERDPLDIPELPPAPGQPLSSTPVGRPMSYWRRFHNLRAHMQIDARAVRYILVGEAPGYQGCHFSGVPFTSERLINQNAIPRIRDDSRITTRKLSFAEPSATIVWGQLRELGIADCTVLWNAFPFHPIGNNGLLSNRTPTAQELNEGKWFLHCVLHAFPRARRIAVGANASKAIYSLLSDASQIEFEHVRHPANGGATEFRKQLRSIVCNN